MWRTSTRTPETVTYILSLPHRSLFSNKRTMSRLAHYFRRTLSQSLVSNTRTMTESRRVWRSRVGFPHPSKSHAVYSRKPDTNITGPSGNVSVWFADPLPLWQLSFPCFRREIYKRVASRLAVASRLFIASFLCLVSLKPGLTRLFCRFCKLQDGDTESTSLILPNIPCLDPVQDAIRARIRRVRRRQSTRYRDHRLRLCRQVAFRSSTCCRTR